MAVRVKGIRCTEDDLERNRLLRVHRDDDESESELMLKAMRLGIRILSAEAWAAGEGQYGGYDPQVLAQRLQADLLPVLEFLLRQDALPALLQGQGMHSAGVVPMASAPTPPPAGIQREASGAVLAFSGGFLDDDE
ncbi:hypothetical protein [Herpetosiphon gulosus]|uniref:Uncharacterized protein n=1 Tax=Herpetosiphon gulosus TaxID=1973496 RepID=A0ABP9X7J8_9CHLR